MDITKLADDYLLLKAEKAELAKREKALKEAIIATGLKEIDGDLGRVTCSFVDGAEKVDYTKAAKELIAEAVLCKYTKWQSAAYRFVVKARVADDKPEVQA